METGVVKFFNHTKGWGYIKDDHSDGEYFAHKNDCKEKINQDDGVSFEIREQADGRVRAVNVQKL